MNVGIVGHEAAKFTLETESKAKHIIEQIILDTAGIDWPCDAVTVVSGHSPLGGIDIWAEEIADKLDCDKLIFPPAHNTWIGGYKERNLQIASNSDIVHCIVVSQYPQNYTGMRFNKCYHCHTNDHIKSGGCYTMHHCKQGKLWIID